MIDILIHLTGYVLSVGPKIEAKIYVVTGILVNNIHLYYYT